eukprot:290209-Ditylum_brightwellii.AAC.1
MEPSLLWRSSTGTTKGKAMQLDLIRIIILLYTRKQFHFAQTNGDESEEPSNLAEDCLRFRLVSVIGGNPNSIGTSLYSDQHVAVLDSMLETLKPQYIMGTCTSVSSLEKALALKHKTVLMAQVGPPGFYKDNNPYVFGIHVNSDTYPLPALQSLRFHINGE